MLILVRRYQSEMTNLLSPFGGNSNPFFFRQEEGSILGSINGVDHVYYDGEFSSSGIRHYVRYRIRD